MSINTSIPEFLQTLWRNMRQQLIAMCVKVTNNLHYGQGN